MNPSPPACRIQQRLDKRWGVLTRPPSSGTLPRKGGGLARKNGNSPLPSRERVASLASRVRGLYARTKFDGDLATPLTARRSVVEIHRHSYHLQ